MPLTQPPACEPEDVFLFGKLPSPKKGLIVHPRMLEEKDLAPRGDRRLIFRVGIDDEEIPFLEMMFYPRGDFEDINRSLENVWVFRDERG
jgi:hypothetical protein